MFTLRVIGDFESAGGFGHKVEIGLGFCFNLGFYVVGM